MRRRLDTCRPRPAAGFSNFYSPLRLCTQYGAGGRHSEAPEAEEAEGSPGLLLRVDRTI